jgi:A/G-specific adenine glycosylase
MDKVILKKLQKWFCENAESLPWRPRLLEALRDPYAVWISETMLQQTQVATVKDYFVRWMKRFPDLDSLAKANEAEVFKFWQGLGYYNRAKNILKTAKIVAPQMPDSRKELEALPGIGAYTAGAILSLAFHKNEAILDGNLVRIFSRFYALDFLPDSAIHKEIYWDKARLVACGEKAFLRNEALMELGRNVCKVKNPACEKCPLKSKCLAFQNNLIEKFPPKKDRVYKHWYGVIFVVQSADKKFFITENSEFFLKNQKVFPHFPIGETEARGIPARVDTFLNGLEVTDFFYGKDINHSITHFKISMRTLFLNVTQNAPKNSSWISKKELKDLPSSLCKKVLIALKI